MQTKVNFVYTLLYHYTTISQYLQINKNTDKNLKDKWTISVGKLPKFNKIHNFNTFYCNYLDINLKIDKLTLLN